VRPLSRFGVMDLGADGAVERFREKPVTDDYVNAGFFVFEPAVFSYLSDDCVLEQGPLEALARDEELMAYRHDGFWQPMDTYREYTMLNQMWDKDEAPWRVWK
jgi:glucose-1-phosphate cytidylyltransferase